jgi:hypothetical protein
MKGRRMGGARVAVPHLNRIRSVHDGTRCFFEVSNVSQLRSYLKVGGKVRCPSSNPSKTRPSRRSRVS